MLRRSIKSTGKIFGKKLQRQALPLPTFHKYIRGVEEFFDGIKFDPNNPTAYLKV